MHINNLIRKVCFENVSKPVVITYNKILTLFRKHYKISITSYITEELMRNAYHLWIEIFFLFFRILFKNIFE